MVQVFNEINCRKIRDEVNVFAGIWRSRTFLYIIGITVALQVRSLFSSSPTYTLTLHHLSSSKSRCSRTMFKVVWCSGTSLLSPRAY